MHSLKHKKLLLVLILVMALGQSFAQYEVKNHTINSGGSTMSNDNYEMTASIGQTDASNQQSNGSYKLNGGFWHENTNLIFKNGF